MTAPIGPASSDEPDGGHFLGLEGAKAIPTQNFQMAHAVVRGICSRGSIGVLHGDAGHGKTFAMRHAIATVTDRKVDVIEFPIRATARHVAGSLAKQLTGVEESGERRHVIDAAMQALRSTQRLLVVDEAQRLDLSIIELLRYFHDDRRTSFALLLVGGNECWRVLSRYPMLRSRIQQRWEFARMHPNEVPGLIRAFHPMWRDASDELIMRLDDEQCLGVWRSWASLTVTLVDLAAAMGKDPLDPAVVNFATAVTA